jgi:hypothetical protein
MSRVGTHQTKRVLLVCPRFFSYHTLISNQLAELGCAVQWWDDRLSHATLYKFALRKFPLIVGLLSSFSFVRRVRAVPFDDFDHVLVVKGEALSRRVTAALRRQFPSARFALYFWDAVENAPNAQASSDLFDYVATFDPVDAPQYGWHYRPLFASAALPVAKRGLPQYDWSFVGTIHSDRLRLIHHLYMASPDRSRVFVFGYFPSKLLKFVSKLLNRRIFASGIGTMSTSALSAEQSMCIMAQSSAVLDIEHPKQRGLTIRTIEALLANCKLITTNDQILKSPLFDPSRVWLLDRSKPEVSNDFLQRDYVPVPDDVRYTYSIRCWVIEMLGLQRDLGQNGK